MTTTINNRTPATSTRRLERVREQLGSQGWSGILVFDHTDIAWLTGLHSSNAALLVTATGAVIATDFRYATEAAATGAAIEVHQLDQGLYASLGRELGGWTGGGAVAYEPASLTHRAFLQLTEDLSSSCTLRAVDGVVGRLRQIKDPAELDAIRRSAALLELAFAHVRDSGLVGKTERQVAWEIERTLREAGAEGLSFDSIVAGGPNGALPHHRPGLDPIPNDTLVTLDIGCVVDGYCSDCTRTFATGDPGDELRRIHAITLQAQLAALDAVRPGANGRDIDAVARDIIEQAGHGEHFGHGLGHGVGMEVHEAPRLARTSKDILDVGMVVTVEPGIYLPGIGGVRIEDLVIVTEGPPEVLTNFTKDLITVG